MPNPEANYRGSNPERPRFREGLLFSAQPAAPEAANLGAPIPSSSSWRRSSPARPDGMFPDPYESVRGTIHDPARGLEHVGKPLPAKPFKK